MYRGTIVEIGDRDGVFAAPAHPYTQLLIRSTPTLVPGTRMPGPAARTRNEAGAAGAGCVFRPRCEHAQARCAVEAPALRPLGAGRTVACHVAAAVHRDAA